MKNVISQDYWLCCAFAILVTGALALGTACVLIARYAGSSEAGPKNDLCHPARTVILRALSMLVPSAFLIVAWQAHDAQWLAPAAASWVVLQAVALFRGCLVTDQNTSLAGTLSGSGPTGASTNTPSGRAGKEMLPGRGKHEPRSSRRSVGAETPGTRSDDSPHEGGIFRRSEPGVAQIPLYVKESTLLGANSRFVLQGGVSSSSKAANDVFPLRRGIPGGD